MKNNDHKELKDLTSDEHVEIHMKNLKSIELIADTLKIFRREIEEIKEYLRQKEN